jgi:hypothetical protein
MPELKIPFIQGEVSDNEFPVNLYMDPLSFNGENAMVGTPGCSTLISLAGVDGEVRGMIVSPDKENLYVIQGKKVYRASYTSSGSFMLGTTIGSLESARGHVWMACTPSYVLIVDGVKGYYIDHANSGNVTIVSDTDFVVPSCLTSQDNYFIVGQQDTFNYQISGLNDPINWSGLDIGTAEGSPDNITSILSDHRQIFAMGPDSGEVIYNSGNSVFPFERYPDVFIEDGIDAPLTLKKFDNSVGYLSINKQLKRIDGFTPKVISPPRLSSIIKSMQTTDDGFAFVYTLGNHTFYVITFPKSDLTYSYDASTGLVHKWSSGLYGGRHLSNCYAYFKGKHIVGDYREGILYTLEENVYTDGDDPIRWEYTSPVFELNKAMLFHKELEILFESGVGATTGDGIDPVVMMQYSDDYGKTWSPESWRKLGKRGKYKNRVRWARLGGSRSRSYKLFGTDPVKRKFKASILDIEVGRG